MLGVIIRVHVPELFGAIRFADPFHKRSGLEPFAFRLFAGELLRHYPSLRAVGPSKLTSEIIATTEVLCAAQPEKYLKSVQNDDGFNQHHRRCQARQRGDASAPL